MTGNGREEKSGSSRKSEKGQRVIKDSLFPVSLFAIYLGVLFLMSGFHVGLVVMMNKLGWNEIIQSAVPMLYWGIVAVGLTLPYFLYKMGVKKQTERITPLIEEKYDEIYEICEKGSKLLM